MSKDNVKKMFVKMEKDVDLKKKYTELMLAHQKETEKTLSDKLVNFGQTSGFTFSNSDLLAARAEIIDKVNSNKELSDGDLNNVAGGGAQKAGIIMASIITVGIACAAVSAITEVNKHGACGVVMSTTAAC